MEKGIEEKQKRTLENIENCGAYFTRGNRSGEYVSSFVDINCH